MALRGKKGFLRKQKQFERKVLTPGIALNKIKASAGARENAKKRMALLAKARHLTGRSQGLKKHARALKSGQVMQGNGKLWVKRKRKINHKKRASKTKKRFQKSQPKAKGLRKKSRTGKKGGKPKRERKKSKKKKR